MPLFRITTQQEDVDSDRAVRLSAKEGLILQQLAGKPEMFGLEMVQNDPKNLPKGTIYVTLNRLQEKGFIRSRKVERDENSNYPRRLYRISGLGQRVLAAKQFDEAAAAPEAVI